MSRPFRGSPILFIIASLLPAFDSGCAKEPVKPVRSGAPSATPSVRRIAVIPKSTSHAFWQTVKAGAEAAGADAAATIIWTGPSKETDITGQIDILQNQVNGKVDGIVLAACDSKALIKPVKDAMARNVPVVTIDSGLSEDASLCYIATDNVQGGRLAAQALAKEVGGKGKVGLLSIHKGAASSDQREQGFLEEIKKYPKIELVSTLYSESDVATALDQTYNMLTSHPDLAGIFASAEPGAVGAANALRQKKLAGKIKLVGFDASPEEIGALQQGIIQVLIVQDPYKMGYEGVKTVLRAIDKEPITNSRVDSGVTAVTAGNMSDTEVHKLLYPLGP